MAAAAQVGRGASVIVRATGCIVHVRAVTGGRVAAVIGAGVGVLAGLGDPSFAQATRTRVLQRARVVVATSHSIVGKRALASSA